MRNVPDQQRLNPRPNTEPVEQQGQESADSDRMRSLLSWTQQTGPEAQYRESGTARGWPGALSLLHQATEAIRASADQSERMEARARGLLARATEFPFAWRTWLDETVMVVRPAGRLVLPWCERARY